MEKKAIKPLPTSLQSDFIPMEIMEALSVRQQAPDKLDPPDRLKRLPARAASVWNYPQRRERLKHLTENAACVCGAGKNISFLYDVLTTTDFEPTSTLQQSTKLSLLKRGVTLTRDGSTEMKLADTLIPSEYHVVKNKGVETLEYRDEPFTTMPLGHKEHGVVFPSMHPASKQELKQIRQNADSLLTHLGMMDDFTVSGPTQMHRLLELVKKEQDIYNVLFFEIIRQTTVECTERGEIMARLRQGYKSLLERAPQQVKGLHDEVMAQRALDRRLTEELLRFKKSINGLTAELSEVKKHDQQSFSDAQFTREELKAALEEAKRSTNLLEEYHILYELQRQRLNAQVSFLVEERKLWRRAAYDLSLRVTQQSRLATVMRLHKAETAWQHLATIFTALLAERDSQSTAAIKEDVCQWRQKAEDMALLLTSRDRQTAKVIVSVRDKIDGFRYAFEEAYLRRHRSTKEGHMVKTPDMDRSAEILNNVTEWEQLLSNEVEQFGGDAMLTMQENMAVMKRLVLNWTDTGLGVFMRHKQEENGENYPEHDTMLRVNKEIDELMAQFTVRLIGENGVARVLISLINILESWHSRIGSSIHNGKHIPETEWNRFYVLLDDWIGMLEEAEQCVGRTQKEEDFQAHQMHHHLEVSQVIGNVNKWMESSQNGIDSEDMRLSERVATTHTFMIRWMVQTLLRLAPDHPGNSREAHFSALLASASPADIEENARVLCEQLSKFTKYLGQCCQSVVAEIMQKKIDLHQDDADFEANQLKQLNLEAENWTSVVNALLEELSSGEVVIATEPEEPEEEEEGVKDTEELQQELNKNLEVGEEFVPPKTPDMEPLPARTPSLTSSDRPKERTIESIGFDKNTHARELIQSPDSPQEDNVALEPGLQKADIDTAYAFDTLKSVQEFQAAVRKQEEIAQNAEESCMTIELDLAETNERIRSLKQRLEIMRAEINTLEPPEPKEEEAKEETGEAKEDSKQEAKEASEEA